MLENGKDDVNEFTYRSTNNNHIRFRMSFKVKTKILNDKVMIFSNNGREKDSLSKFNRTDFR